MTDDALAVVSFIFGPIYRIFTSWYIPGTNVTPALAHFGALFIYLIYRVLGEVFGLWGDEK